MSDPASGRENLLLFGATGMVGAQALQAALADDRVGAVVAIGRRMADVEHSKLRQILHTDFLSYDGLEDVLAQADACVFCLAVYQSQVSKARYEEITVRYPATLIAKLAQVNPGIRFCLHGAAGAAPRGKSPATFARVKGMAENALTESPLTNRHIFRPALIVPPPETRGWWWPAGLLDLLFKLAPGTGLSAADLGRAMANVAITGNAPEVLENSVIRRCV